MVHTLATNSTKRHAEFAATCPFAIQYVYEPRRGISRARTAKPGNLHKRPIRNTQVMLVAR